MDRSHLVTEQRNPDSMELDGMSPLEIVDLMNRQSQLVLEAVEREREHVAKAIEMVTRSLRLQGRLFYVGAGTSGRLGMLDASECPPTFGTPPWWVQGIMAGGPDALIRSVERAEDDPEQGAAQVRKEGVDGSDTVMGIATGSTTPFVVGAVREARKRGAATIFFTCNPAETVPTEVDLVIAPVVGPEIVTGSTRLKAGTATKLVLNAITTGAMVQLGKVYENLMVDLRRSCSKLEDRAARIVRMATGVSQEEAETLLDAADGEAKVALCMRMCRVDCRQATMLLSQHGGSLRRVLASHGAVTSA